MTRAASFGALAVLALASACAPAPPEAAKNHSANLSDEIVVPAPPAEANIAGPSAPVVQIAPDGLTVTPVGGEAHQVSFGLSRQAVAAELGEPEAEGTATDCGAGPIDYARYPGGLSLSFQEGSFAGWTLDGGTYRSAEGIGIGSTRRQLDAAGPVTVMDQSTIGIEFTGSDFSGLLDSPAPTGKVTHLWAGITCIAR